MSLSSPGTRESRSGHCPPPPLPHPTVRGHPLPFRDSRELRFMKFCHRRPFTPVLSGAGDSELTHSANLQRGKHLGGNHQFTVQAPYSFGKHTASREASGCFIWAFCQRQWKQDSEAQGDSQPLLCGHQGTASSWARWAQSQPPGCPHPTPQAS